LKRPAVILVMCGSSIVATNLVANKLESEAKRRKVQIETKKGKITDMDALISQHNPDLVVATAVVKEPQDVKIFSGVPMISTIGEEKQYDQIFGFIRELNLNLN